MAAEKKFEEKVKRYLERKGIYSLGTPPNKMKHTPIGYYAKRWGGGFSKAGLPDMQIVIHGQCLEVELKDDQGVVSDLQKHNIKQINRAGGVGLVIAPKNMHELEQHIETYTKGK